MTLREFAMTLRLLGGATPLRPWVTTLRLGLIRLPGGATTL
jgi:hypothetical protein